MNRAMLIGRLTKDPELRATGSGIAVCTFTLAVDRRFANRDSQTREADFIPVVVWRAQAENCAKYLHKGSQAAICGSIQTRTYDAPDGTKRYITEVVADEVQFLGRPNNGDNNEDAARAASLGNSPFGDNMQAVEDEEIPF
ncbi:MAG: single-stranded DNA-binding protein [Clostridia bacterium]|nr:single-stranded DNA-binding protein [Clostridia bacterium]